MQFPITLSEAFLREIEALAPQCAPPNPEACWALGKVVAQEEASAKLPLRQWPPLALPPALLRAAADFYRTLPEWSADIPELSWTHYRLLLVIKNPELRLSYWREALQNQWSTRELARQIQSRYCERHPPHSLREDAPRHAAAWIKDPYVLEFLPLPSEGRLLERDMEEAMILRLQYLLLELGKGFAFVARQKRLATATGKRYFIDRVFYHFILKCFVLVDLKAGELSHRDIGQMDMYVRFFEEKWRGPADNPTVGLILCRKKDQTLVRYSALSDNDRLFASTYRLHLPTEEELCNIIS